MTQGSSARTSDNDTAAYFSTRRTPEGLEIELQGEWRVIHFPELDRQLSQLPLEGVTHVTISTRAVKALDLSASWRLREFLERARQAGVTVSFKPGQPDTLRLIDATLGEAAEQAPPKLPESNHVFTQPVGALGKQVVAGAQEMLKGLAFIGRLTTLLLAALTKPRRMRPTAITRHIYDTGITAIPIVSLIAFLISVIIAYMSAQQLQSFGADIFVVDLVTIGVLRELGVLLTAIIVAGRSGSAFAAEIGAMRLNEEVDALEATGVDPFEVLILPRIIGLVIALPLLTVIADAVGLTGGALLCHYLLDMPLQQYLSRVNDAISSTTFWVGIIKAPVFALLIATAGTYRGLQVRNSSRELGRLTTVAVVQSIFLVILADALFAVLFMELDI